VKQKFMGRGGRSRSLLACLGLATVAMYGGQKRTSESPGSVQIQIDTSQRAGYTIPRTIFGTFLEPIGNSTYNGLWAELLQNPSLEENLWSASQVAQMITQEPALAQASQLGLPLPWQPLDPTEGNRYEARWGDAANSWRSLAILGVPGRATGIKQQVYLPIHRELRYTGSLYAKHLSGPAELEISLRIRGEKADVLARAVVSATDAQWHKYLFQLEVPNDRLRALEPVDFVIALTGDERVQLDQMSLIPADAVGGMDPEMIRLAREMHTPLVRFGGNFTSAYHWRDGVGSADKRVSMLNIAWGIPETNQFGTDEFLRFCQLIGAEPQIALNLGSGTAEEAAAWVRYVNDRWPSHGGLLWELGNELWGNWNLGSPTLEELPARTRSFSEAIHQVDPRARLIATGQDPDQYAGWNAAQLTNPPGTFNFLSTHFVVTMDRVEQKQTADTVALDGFALPLGLGRQLRKMQSQIDQTAGYRGKAHLAFTEWLWVCCDGKQAPDAPRWDNMAGAVTTAGFLNMLLQNADIVPISDMTGIIEFAGIWKKRGRVFGTPAYYVFGMYAGADLETPVHVSANADSYNVQHGVSRLPEIPDVPYLDVAAVLSKDERKLTLFCVNRHLDQDIPAEMKTGGFRGADGAQVEVLRSDSIYDVNDELRPQAVVPVHSKIAVNNGAASFTFPRASVTRIEFSQ
jgi:alpha-N-arabinofuranosidase